VIAEELPLLDLFTRLREAGLPLGIDEYRLVLRALQGGFGVSDRTALKRLCQTLWVKSSDDARLFDYHFEQVMGMETISAPPQTSASPASEDLQKNEDIAEWRKISQISRYVALGGAFILGMAIVWGVGLYTKSWVEKVFYGGNELNLIFWGLLFIIALIAGSVLVRWLDKQLIIEQRIGNDNSLAQPSMSASTSVLTSELTLEMEDEVQVAKSLLQAAVRDDEIPYSRFILTSEYFPLTQRQMKQIWRYLRHPVREGAPTELDIEATVNQIGQQGVLLEPVLVPRRVNRTELLLLIDQDGSMVPFHALSHRLAETAVRGGRLGKAGIYYFRNCPVDYFYHDSYHQEAEAIGQMLPRLPQRTAVLIFSDAGAARGGYSEERIELTQMFLTQLRQRIRYIAWLNPMPQKRWFGTTAGEIADLVPMFEMTRRGLQDAINVLRGRK
jgi:uncharacterized protein with von Willebrand factor type A (vWA) domain